MATPDTILKTMRNKMISRIQAESRDAREEIQQDVAEGATTEPAQMPPYLISSANPVSSEETLESEYQETEI